LTVLFSSVFTFAYVCAQAQSAAPTDSAAGSALLAAPVEIQSAYAHARPFLDYPLPKLQTIVPAVKGVKPDPSQERLPVILSRTGEVVQALLPEVPNLTANEAVSQVTFPLPYMITDNSQQAFRGGISNGMQYQTQHKAEDKEVQQLVQARLLSPVRWKQFNYLILSQPTTDKRVIFDESRTDLHNQGVGLVEQDLNSPSSTEFGNLWLLFVPENLSQSHFHYVGQQKIDGHETFVVAFAQDVDRVSIPGEISLHGNTYPLFSQGVAWIDQTTFRIVRLQTDLLAPLPSIQLRRLTSEIRFSEVRIRELGSALWLPKQVEIQWEESNQISAELHLYTNYRLFHARVKILPPS
jgi:hypothetical protein